MEESYIKIYARNCLIKEIDNEQLKLFLNKYHNLGHTKGRYKYGMFIKKRGAADLDEGSLVAVALFSKAKKWDKNGKIVRSHEWIRFVSLENTRVSGAMGKFLKHFIEEVRPDDIMTYVDSKSSSGSSYKSLGFVPESIKNFDNGHSSLKLRLIINKY